MSEGLGARLRRQREEQGIALHTIAGETKIKLSLLEGLERDDVSQWPSGIFRRAYVRSYAQAIGLDPNMVAAEFLEANPDSREEVTTDAIEVALDGARGKAAPPTRLRCIVGSALGSLARLRRTPGTGRPAEGGDAVPLTAAARHEPDLPLPVDPCLELSPVDVPLELDRDEPSERPARSTDIGRQDVLCPSTEQQIHPGSEVVASGEMLEDISPAAAPAPVEPDFTAVAALCTELGRAGSHDAVQRALQQAAAVLDATGLIVWLWDRWAGGLRPALAHGYSDAVVAQLPVVGSDADNATAAAFRSARACAIDGGPRGSGALVVPLLTAEGCAGVLAIELEHGRAQMASVRAAATILAAQLAGLAGGPPRDARPSRISRSPPSRIRANI
jgi:hypothetical protein